NTDNNRLKEGIKSLEHFVSEHQDILITRADKGNSTVIMDSKEYYTKMHKILSDKKTYTNINKDPLNMITKQTHTLLTR
ncbi:hypothetical protein ALC60_11693, partial [Trachymyrmex zeteki]